MTDDSATTPDASVLGRPNSYIGRSVPRPNARRLLSGHGRFVDDIKLQRMVHVAFVRSPYAHARITDVDTNAAAASAGVVRVVTGQELAEHCPPWVGVLPHCKTPKSAPQHALATEHAWWPGEAVAGDSAQSSDRGRPGGGRGPRGHISGKLSRTGATRATWRPRFCLDAIEAQTQTPASTSQFRLRASGSISSAIPPQAKAKARSEYM